MAAKKSFVAGNPALQFISEHKEETVTPAVKEPAVKEPAEPVKKKADIAAASRAEAVPEGFKPNPLYIEKKTRRLQMLMQPSLHAKVKEAADEAGLSVNDYIHRVLEEKLKGE